MAMASAYNNLCVLVKMLGKKGLQRVQQTGNMAGMEIVTSRLRKAISYFSEHLFLVEQLYDRSKQSVAFANLGSCHEMLIQYPLAIHYHYQQLIVTQELRDYRGSLELCVMLVIV
ncbi:G-protein-signaling modulator 2-like [Dysidea avara]|uniref:G-protein-signaling modulator 2-like n=1 Tax=Dysidea avara TaxID=196820 RepID=UPI00331C1A75